MLETSMRLFLYSLLLGLAGCPDSKDDTATNATDSDADTDTDADTDADSDTDTDADTDADTDTDPERQGLYGVIGSAVADVGTYSGTEEMYLLGEEDQDICRIGYTVTWTATRTDCDICNWAADLTFSNAAILAESDVGCAALGFGGTDVAMLDGVLASRGYVAEYYGHAAVLMSDDGTGWDAVSFANWDEATGEFAYDWQDGYRPY